MQHAEIAADYKESKPASFAHPSTPLIWKFWYIRDCPEKAAPTFGLIALSGLAAYFLFHSTVFAIAASSLIFASVAEALIPLTYRLDYEKVTVKLGWFDWLEMPWGDVKSVYGTRQGIKLSVFTQPALVRSESFRGIHLKFTEDRRKMVQDIVSRAVISK